MFRKNSIFCFSAGFIVGILTGFNVFVQNPLSGVSILEAMNSSILKTTDLNNISRLETSGRTTDSSGNSSSKGNDLAIKLLCMVTSTAGNNTDKIIQVWATWGKKCDILFFLGPRPYKTLPTVTLPPSIPEGRDRLWAKTKFGFSYAYSNHFEDADWFLKADDDTYIVVENLKRLLSRYNTSEPLYLGCHFKTDFPEGYMSGGAGYILSKESLKRFIERALLDRRCSEGVTISEDIEMGRCLNDVGVKFVDTRDFMGRGRFFPVLPFENGLFLPGHLNHDTWYWGHMYNRADEGFECCSEYVVSFHYVDPQLMQLIDFFLYNLNINRRYV